MADFNKAYEIIKKHEGGYVPKAVAEKIKDTGGETYKGISRNNNPNWIGWKIIDSYKAKFGIPKLNAYIPNTELDQLVKDLAKKNYWDSVKLDLVKDQFVANFIMDIAFNSGPGTAIKSIQNVLKVAVDGKIGPVTINTLNAQKPDEFLHKLGDYRTAWLEKYQAGKPYLKTLLARTASYLDAYKKPLAGGGLAVAVIALTLFFLSGSKNN
jgi:lysozyme family protein